MARQKMRDRVVVIRNIAAAIGVAQKFATGKVVLADSAGQVQVASPGDVDRLLGKKRAAGYSADEVDAEGGVLLPGYHNGHYHTIYALLEALMTSYSPFGKTNKRDLCDALKPEAADPERRGKGIILAYGLNTVQITDLTRTDLDNNVESDLPVIVFDASYHGAVANSAALALIREKARQKEKETGTKLVGECTDDGKLTEDYVFLGFALMDDKFGSSVPESAARQADVIFNWLKEQVKAGITSMDDMISFTPAHTLAVIRAAETWEKETGTPCPIQKLYVRPEVLKMLQNEPEKYREVREALDSWIGQGKAGVKLLADGSFGSFTARVRTAYTGTKLKGTLFDSTDRAREAVALAQEFEMSSVRMHAIGDDGIRHALRAMEHAREVLGHDAHLGIEHFELGGFTDILDAAQRIGVTVCIQTNFLTDWHDYRERLGKRVERIDPIVSLLDRDIPVVLGDDGMPPGYLTQVMGATHHPVESERVSAIEAIELASRTHAFAKTGEEVPNLVIATPDAVGALYCDQEKPEAVIQAQMTSQAVWSDRFANAITHVMISGMVAK